MEVYNSKLVRLFNSLDEAFNLEDVIGDEAARRYYGQAEAVKFGEEDEQKVVVRLIKYFRPNQ